MSPSVDKHQLARLGELAEQLAALADARADSGHWPEDAVQRIADAGVWQWVIPAEYGGAPLDGPALLQGYEELAAGCLTTALLVTQQHGACELIAAGDNDELKRRLLPAFASGGRRCTLGISQLTTSKRGGARQMTARRDGQQFSLHGRMPWASGPARCNDIVTAALLEDDQQLLVCLPLDAPGVRVGEPMALLALEASWTTWVDCQDVAIEPQWVIRGPADNVLARRSTVKPLTVSAVGLGAARALLSRIEAAGSGYPEDFAPAIARCSARFAAVRQALYDGLREMEATPDAVSATDLRTRVNDLVSRLSTVALVLAKGSGYLRDHRAQRLCREALFFLVWSSPQALQRQTIEGLLAAW